MDVQVLERLNRGIANKGQTISEMSEKLEIDRSIFNKFVNGQRIPNIEVIMKILNYLFPKQSDRYMILKSLVPSFKSIQPLKVMLEMARLNRDEETVTKAANILKNASKQKDKEWADFYLLWQEFRSGTLDKDKYLETLLAIPLQSEELLAFRKLSLCHFYFTISNIPDTAWEYCTKAKTDIDALSPSLIKDSYLARYYGYKGQLLMRTNDLDHTIHSLEKSNQLSISDLMKGINHHNLAVALQYYDHQKSIHYFNQAQSRLREFAEYDSSLIPFSDYIIQEVIPLIKIVANDFEDIIEEDLLYSQSKVFYNIRMGNLSKANEILNNIPLEEKDDEFYLLCRGIIDKDIPTLIQSLSLSIEKFQFNEAQLPIRELLKLGCDPSIIDSMINARLGNRKNPVNT